MLRWLLKHEGYPPGIVFAVLLHGGLILFLILRQFQAQEPVDAIKPVFITASITKENPQQQRAEQQRVRERQQQTREQQQRQAEAERQRQEQERQRQAETSRQREADVQKQREAEAEKQRQAQAQQQRQAEADKQRQAEAEQQRQADAEKQRQTEAERQRQADAEKQRQAEAERQRQADAEKQRQAEAERQRQADAERQAAAAAEADASATNLVSQYAALISDLVSQNWTRPPNAINGMTAVVEIHMTPTGDIVSSTIIQSSGDANYDRSVDQAVKRLGRVPEMQDLPNAVFERNFRVFSLTFTPEDLLR